MNEINILYLNLIEIKLPLLFYPLSSTILTQGWHFVNQMYEKQMECNTN